MFTETISLCCKIKVLSSFLSPRIKSRSKSIINRSDISPVSISNFGLVTTTLPLSEFSRNPPARKLNLQEPYFFCQKAYSPGFLIYPLIVTVFFITSLTPLEYNKT